MKRIIIVTLTLLLVQLSIVQAQKKAGKLKDYDGNTYNTVQIGEQIWMAENLKSLHYADGKPIEGVYAYNDDKSMVNTYGYLYTWKATTRSSITETNQGVCPNGWHVPSEEEWKTLETFLGMEAVELEKLNWRGKDEGGKLKSKGTKLWKNPNVGGTNNSGFKAIPSGFRNPLGKYSFNEFYALFWSSTEKSEEKAWYRLLGYNLAKIARSTEKKENAYSVRCVKDK